MNSVILSPEDGRDYKVKAEIRQSALGVPSPTLPGGGTNNRVRQSGLHDSRSDYSTDAFDISQIRSYTHLEYLGDDAGRWRL